MNIEQLYAYLDGELSPAEAAEVERAAAADPAVALQLDELRALDQALGALPGVETDGEFTERVVRAARRRRSGRIVRLLIPLAAAAAILVAVVWNGREEAAPAEIFTAEDYADYVWEADAETYGTLALDDLEDEILKELGET